MKRVSLLFIAATLLVAASFGISNASPNGQLDQILDNMQKNAANITTIYAKMDMAKHYSDIGGAPEKNSAEIFFKHTGKNNDKVRINYFIPNGQTIWVVGDTITLYQAPLQQAIITSRQSAAAKGDVSFVATPYTSVPELKRQFNISYAGEEQGLAKLELTPKGKSTVKKLTLWVDQSTWLPTKYQIVEANSTISTFTLSRVKTNGVISNGTFDVKLPEGTKKVHK